MVNDKINSSRKRLSMIFILLVLFGTSINFLSTYDFIGPSINLTEEDKVELLEISKAYQDPYMAWRFGLFNYYELLCTVLACCAIFYPCVIDKKIII